MLHIRMRRKYFSTKRVDWTGNLSVGDEHNNV